MRLSRFADMRAISSQHRLCLPGFSWSIWKTIGTVESQDRDETLLSALSERTLWSIWI